MASLKEFRYEFGLELYQIYKQFLSQKTLFIIFQLHREFIPGDIIKSIITI